MVAIFRDRNVFNYANRKNSVHQEYDWICRRFAVYYETERVKRRT